MTSRAWSESPSKCDALSTKLGGRPDPFDPKDKKGLRFSVDESLRLLGRDQVDPLPHLLHGSVRGRSVLVTGAGGGLGTAIATRFAAEGLQD